MGAKCKTGGFALTVVYTAAETERGTNPLPIPKGGAISEFTVHDQHGWRSITFNPPVMLDRRKKRFGLNYLIDRFVAGKVRRP